MPQYAMYLRKSRSDIELEALGEGQTLAKHRSILQKLAAKHSIPMTDVTVYQEIVSGDTIADRPQMQQLLTDIYKRKYAAVLVVEIERLARGSTSDQGQVADAFVATGTKIVTPLKVYDPSNPFDQQYFEFGLFMSRREFQTIRRRLQAGRAQALKQGSYISGHCCYGYQIEKHGKKFSLVVVPQKAEVVRSIFNWFTEDRMTCGEIAKRLTAMQIPTATGADGWIKNTVKFILKNIHYTGCIRVGEYTSTKVFDDYEQKIVKTIKHHPQEEQTIIPNCHEAIISMEQYREAQAIFGTIPKVKNCTTLVNPYAGLIKCPICGMAYRYKQIKCVSYIIHAEEAVCVEKHRMPLDIFSQAVCDSLKGIIDDYQFQISDTGEKKKREKSKRQLILLQQKLAKAKLMRGRLYDAFESGVYTSDEFIDRRNKANASITELQQLVKQEQSNIDNCVDFQGKISTIHQTIDSINDSSINAREKNILLKQLIDHIDLKLVKGKNNRDLTPFIDIYTK